MREQLIEQYEVNIEERLELLKALTIEVKGHVQSVVKLLATTLKTEITINWEDTVGGLQFILTIGKKSKVSQPLPIELIITEKGRNYIEGEVFNLVGQIFKSGGG